MAIEFNEVVDARLMAEIGVLLIVAETYCFNRETEQYMEFGNYTNNLSPPNIMLSPLNNKLKLKITTIKIGQPNNNKHSPNNNKIMPNNNKWTKYSTKSSLKKKTKNKSP